MMSRSILPLYIQDVYIEDSPMLKQSNVYELKDGNWRIRKKTDYTYNTFNGSTSFDEIHIRDFAKISPVNPASRLPLGDIYSLTGIDSFFDYSFYGINLRSRYLGNERVVDYKYNE